MRPGTRLSEEESPLVRWSADPRDTACGLHYLGSWARGAIGPVERVVTLAHSAWLSNAGGRGHPHHPPGGGAG